MIVDDFQDESLIDRVLGGLSATRKFGQWQTSIDANSPRHSWKLISRNTFLEREWY